jgi:PHD/YefM family antitoxin component YafN of YafNO toxin-antitoxin module
MGEEAYTSPPRRRREGGSEAAKGYTRVAKEVGAMTRMTLADFQDRLAETVRRAGDEPLVLEDSGQAVAVVLSVAEFRRLSEAEIRERERLAQDAFAQVFGVFDRGEFRELSDEDWLQLMNGERTSQHDPESWALPAKG